MWHHEISKIVDLQLIRAPMQYVRGSTLKNLNTKIALNISSRRIVSNLALDSPRPLISWKTLTYFSFFIELLNLTISFAFIAHGAFCIVIALAFFFLWMITITVLECVFSHGNYPENCFSEWSLLLEYCCHQWFVVGAMDKYELKMSHFKSSISLFSS